MATESTEGVALLGYVSIMARWKWLIIGVTVVCAAAGFGYLKTRTPKYRATAELLYVQQVAINNPLVQASVTQTLQQPDIGTLSALIASSQVSGMAGQLLRGKIMSAGYSISATQPTDSNGNTSSSVVGIEGVSSKPQTAAAAANAYAQAFVASRRDSARTQVNDALTAVQAALQSYLTSASKKTAEYLELRQAQQALQLQLQSLTGDFTIISPATAPSVPFSPRKFHTLALAAILGLVLGVGLAFLLEQLDTRVRDERQMVDMLDMSVLGHLPPLERRMGEGATVQMLVNPSGPMAEAVRVLRGNLSFTGVDDDIRSLLITSSIRSEGKSVTACNLAVSVALAGQRVVLVDADFRRPRIHTYMRVPNAVGLSSVLVRHVDVWDATVPMMLEGNVGWMTDGEDLESAGARLGNDAVRIVSVAGAQERDAATQYMLRQRDPASSLDDEPLLRVLPSGPLPPNPGEMAASHRFGEIIATLADTADLVIIDSPPLLEVGDTGAMADKADGVVFVANMAKVRWPMIERAHSQLMKFPCRKIGMVAISARSAQRPGYGYYYRGAASSARGSSRV